MLPLVQVRSCTLDTWLPGQVAFMAHTGNAIANSYWEAGLAPEAVKPSYANLAGELRETRGAGAGCAFWEGGKAGT